MPRFLLFLSSVTIISSMSRSDLVKRRSVEAWSVRSYRDPITAPPTPFPPRFNVPTRPNQANVPSTTTHVPYIPNISKSTSVQYKPEQTRLKPGESNHPDRASGESRRPNIQPPTLPPSRNAQMPAGSTKRPYVPLPTLPPPVEQSKMRSSIVFPSAEQDLGNNGGSVLHLKDLNGAQGG